jgi:drug/metabolite transporter (DMT)-like permease|tara:strand:- start:492 stop:734 length:243 start_codon:yes stop_codon:yes gene_type:complete
MKIKNIKWWRWIGFILAVLGAYILGAAEITSQWIGWTICSLSCIIWIFMAITDKDLPRALMEVMYLILGVRAVISWLNVI